MITQYLFQRLVQQSDKTLLHKTCSNVQAYSLLTSSRNILLNNCELNKDFYQLVGLLWTDTQVLLWAYVVLTWSTHTM